MKNTTRRDFLKKSLLASASALAIPTLFESCKDTTASQKNKINYWCPLKLSSNIKN